MKNEVKTEIDEKIILQAIANVILEEECCLTLDEIVSKEKKLVKGGK